MREATSTIDAEISQRLELIREIRKLFLEKLSIRVESAEVDLFQTGILDSMALVQFIMHMEKHFGLQMTMGGLNVDSFLSVVKIAELVASRKADALS